MQLMTAEKPRSPLPPALATFDWSECFSQRGLSRNASHTDNRWRTGLERYRPAFPSDKVASILEINRRNKVLINRIFANWLFAVLPLAPLALMTSTPSDRVIAYQDRRGRHCKPQCINIRKFGMNPNLFGRCASEVDRPRLGGEPEISRPASTASGKPTTAESFYSLT